MKPRGGSGVKQSHEAPAGTSRCEGEKPWERTVSVRQTGTWTIAALISPKGAETSWEVWSRSCWGAATATLQITDGDCALPPVGPTLRFAELRFAEQAAVPPGAWRSATLLRRRLRRRTAKGCCVIDVGRARRGARWFWPRRSLLACWHERRKGRRVDQRGELAPPQHPTWPRSVGCGSCSRRHESGRLRLPEGAV
jgi:hypothetical protein